MIAENMERQMLQLNSLFERLVSLFHHRGVLSQRKYLYTDADLPIWDDDIKWVDSPDQALHLTYKRPIYTEGDVATM